MLPLPALIKKGLYIKDLCPSLYKGLEAPSSRSQHLQTRSGAYCSKPMARLLLLGLLVLDLVATLAVARPTPAESRVTELDLGGSHSASAPSVSASPGGRELGIAGAPEGAAQIGKRRRPLDKSIAGAEVMLGGLATAIFAAVFAYIRVTRKRSSETKTNAGELNRPDSETLVSDGGAFALGFLPPTNSTTDFYVGIWYNDIPDELVVCVPNRYVAGGSFVGLMSRHDVVQSILSSVGVFNVAVARRWLSVPRTGMSRAIIALSLYNLSWSPRSNGDCTVSDDVVRRVSTPTAARHPRTIGRPSPCQVSSAPDTGWSIISPIILLLPRLSLGLLKARGRPLRLRVSVRGWLTKPCGASSPGRRSIRCRYSRPAVSTSRSRASGCPSGDSRSPVVPSSSGGVALDDSEAVEALTTIRSCFNIDLIVTTRRLVEVRKYYYIPLEYELHVPLLGQYPYNAFSNGFSLSTIALEAGLRFPLHPVIEVCLEGWQISPSQMAPNSFPTEWTSQTVNNSVPTLLVDETELVEILRGILSASRGVKDMNEAWLVEAGLNPAPLVCLSFLLSVPSSFSNSTFFRAEMFNLGKMKSDGVAVSTTEKHPSNDVGASLRKRSKRAAPEEPADASGSTIEALTKKGRESDSKGKEPTEFEEVPEWGYSIRDLCERYREVKNEQAEEKQASHWLGSAVCAGTETKRFESRDVGSESLVPQVLYIRTEVLE
ncbi:hypothetical protein BHE74_00006966, partial [Ensete ventricosum]